MNMGKKNRYLESATSGRIVLDKTTQMDSITLSAGAFWGKAEFYG